MRKFKPLALLSIFLCAVLLLASCGTAKAGGTDAKSLKFKEIVNKSTAEEPAAAAMEAVELEGTVQNTRGELVLLAKVGTSCSVYNAAQNKVVFKTTRLLDSTTVNLYAPDGRTAYFTVQTTDTSDSALPQKTTLYDAAGQEIASVDGLETATRNFDIVFFGKKAYRLGDDSATATLTEITAYSPLKATLPAISAATADYYYCFNVAPMWGGAANNVHIYNKDLSLVSVYSVEGAPNSAASMVLNSGKVLFQAAYQLLPTDENVTYYDGTDNYRLKTVLIDPKTGDGKEIDSEFVLAFGASLGVDLGNGAEEDDGSLNKKIRNLAFISPISDGWLLTGATDRMIVALDGNGKMIGRVDATVANQQAGGFFEEIRTGYFGVPLANGGVLLLNEKGKTIGEVSGADDLKYSYIIAGGKFYDYDLKELYDYEAAGYDLEDAFEHCAILTKENGNGDTEYFRWEDGTVTPLITGTETANHTYGRLLDGIYMISDTTELLKPVVKYYNDRGDLILTLDRVIPLAELTSGEDYALYGGLDSQTSAFAYYHISY